MKSKLNEHSILFFSITKWFILASIMGVFVGILTALFIRALNWATDLSQLHPYYYLLLPAALILNYYLMERLHPQADGHSTDKVIKHIHELKPIRPFSILKAFVGPILTIASGGSAGKEAPAADFGAGVGSALGRTLRMNPADVRKLMICGVSAGFAAVFGTPIAGAIFGVEVLFVGGLLYEVLFPAFTAGIISYQMSAYLGVTYFEQPLKMIPRFNEGFFLTVVASGIFFGLCSFLFIEMMKFWEKITGRFKMGFVLKGLIGGIVLILLTLKFSSLYLGLGLETIESCLNGSLFAWYTPFMKMIFTSITFHSGGSGGIITPVLFVGASSGMLFGKLFGLSTSTFAAIGLVSLMAGTMNTPIAASIMAIELFGPEIAPYAAIACIISFIMTGQRSIYPSQIIRIKKSSTFNETNEPSQPKQE